ncbi:MAG: hypothetical protein K6B70_06320 [Clostridia bacterium]|nr:hypothetical protein [Clostridia bacterium]
MAEKVVLQAAAVAAKWWTNAIAYPTVKNFSNGDPSDNQASFLQLLGHLQAMDHRATDIQLVNFRNTLSKRIEDEINKSGNLELDCELDPCDFLSKVAQSVGINTCLFPFKRKMYITAYSVEIKDGYNSNWHTIFPEEK